MCSQANPSLRLTQSYCWQENHSLWASIDKWSMDEKLQDGWKGRMDDIGTWMDVWMITQSQ